MRVKLISDVHCEFHADGGKGFVENLPNDCDILIIAGDLTTCKAGLSQILTLFCKRFKNVVYTPGNHENYAVHRDKLNRAIKKAKYHSPNLHILNKDVVEIDGQRFLGCTLWFPMTGKAQLLEKYFSDFNTIPGLAKWVYKENTDCQNFLNQEMQENDILITHHLPSFKCVHPKYYGQESNCYFVCDIEKILEEKKPKLGCFGHTHESVDLMLGQTRLLCNPYGYKGHEVNNNFNKNLIIEI